jgi:hypothetical protein
MYSNSLLDLWGPARFPHAASRGATRPRVVQCYPSQAESILSACGALDAGQLQAATSGRQSSNMDQEQELTCSLTTPTPAPRPGGFVGWMTGLVGSLFSWLTPPRMTKEVPSTIGVLGRDQPLLQQQRAVSPRHLFDASHPLAMVEPACLNNPWRYFVIHRR